MIKLNRFKAAWMVLTGKTHTIEFWALGYKVYVNGTLIPKDEWVHIGLVKEESDDMQMSRGEKKI